MAAIVVAHTPVLAPLRPKQRLQRILTIWWHSGVAWARGPGWLTQIVLTVASFSLLALPWWTLGRKPGIGGTIAWVVIGLMRSWKHVHPVNMKLLRRNYTERKLALNLLLRDMQRADELNAAEIARYQREVLALIANYVRSHRFDMDGTKIFANLLVSDGEELVLLARDREHRRGIARYSKNGMLATQALDTGEVVLTGDVYASFPMTPPGKPYHSILAIPVRCDNEIVGVVSIDSSRRYHFDRFKRDLFEALAPYVTLLAWTLKRTTPKISTGGR